MQTIANWSASDKFFWILWGIDLAVMLWWFFSDMKHTHLPMNPAVLLGLGWIAVALILRLMGYSLAGFILAGILAAPIVLMGLFLLLIFVVNQFFGPIRWN